MFNRLFLCLVVLFVCSPVLAGTVISSAINPGNGHTYYLIAANSSGDGVTWTDAEATAVSLGGHLATVRNNLENAWICNTFTGRKDLWMGLNDAAREGTFVWSSGETSSYRKWHPGEPNNANGGEDYGEIYNLPIGQYYWNDFDNRANIFPDRPMYGVAEVASIAPPPQTRINPTAVLTPGKKNLVVITHGANTTSTSFSWVTDMAAAIQTRINTRPDAADWQVVAYDWSALSQVGSNPFAALETAKKLGDAEGSQIANNNYQQVHLIAHSAGAGLIENIAKQIKAVPSGTTVVQETLLDPFAPFGNSGLYGSRANWADQYFTSNDLVWTGALLTNAHNVDVTKLNPSPSPDPTVRHSWSREFYFNSIAPNPPAEYQGYGFPLSIEATSGTWPPPLPVGNDPVVLGGGTSPQIDSTVRLNAPINLAGATNIHSSTGTVQIAGTSLAMTTGSPVWSTFSVFLTSPVNLIAFDMDFTSQPGAEGLLGIYWDSSVVGTVDERYALDGWRNYLFQLGDIQEGAHTLSFRLDSFSDTASSIQIENVATGLVVPEPSMLAMAILPVLLLLLMSKRKQSNQP